VGMKLGDVRNLFKNFYFIFFIAATGTFLLLMYLVQTILTEFIYYLIFEFIFFIVFLALFLIILYNKQKKYMSYFIYSLFIFSFLPLVHPFPWNFNNTGIFMISFAWIFIFKKYFVSNEREVYEGKGFYFGLIGLTISLLFIKVTLEIQLLSHTKIIPGIVLLKENLFWFYSITSQVFGFILSAIVVVTIFILGKYRHKTRRKKVLTQGVIGITLFSIPIIVLSIIGTVLNSDIKMGAEISSFETTVVSLIFSSTLIMTIFCIMFIGMLILSLLEVK
jgi:hypothetical protein